MKKLLLLIGLGISLSGLHAQSGAQTPELRDIVLGKYSARGAGYGMRAMADGEHYTLISLGRNAILRYSYATGALVDTLFSAQTARECPFKTFDDYELSSDGKRVLLFTEQEYIYRRSWQATAYYYDVRRRLVTPLSDTSGPIMIPTLSPDGRMVAFVRDNNIFIKKFDFDTEVQVTRDGQRNAIINGASDWVYEEEFGVTNLLSWSEDGAYLAYVRTDETAVPEYRMAMYQGQLYPTDYAYKYPKAGEANSKVSVHLYHVADRSLKRINLKEDESYYIPRISFVGRGGKLAVMTLNRRQNHLRVIYVDSKTLIPKTIMEERSDTYVDSEHIQSLQFVPEGYIYISERSGWAHIYLVSDQGQVIRQVTKGNWDVTALYGADASGNVYYQSADRSPVERSIYRVDATGRTTALAEGRGTQQAQFAQGYRYYIASHSSLNNPTVTEVRRSSDAKVLRTLEDNAVLKSRLAGLRYAPKELTNVRLADGTVLNGWMVKPADFDPSRRYPLLMVQYSGPNSQQVLDAYRFGWEYYLASQGVVVACVDGRGTGARGEAWRKGTYLRLGVQESLDQAAAARALGALPYIDEGRIGIWGWSFGGYTTLMSLIHGDGAFRLGIAVAPVTDWRYYDTIYTERFMRTPQENPEGYKRASVLEEAHRLRGGLLLIHGSADDNVHVQNSMELSRRLIEAGVQYDMAIYPDQDHSIRAGNASPHIYERMWQYLKRNL